MTLSVIIVTLDRSECVRRCLDCLAAQLPRPAQIIVVDASADDLTRRVVDDFPRVLYLRNQEGYGRMAGSRNIGLEVATGEVVAFIDDDAFVRAGWTGEIVAPYAQADVAAVGGRALNGQAGEEKQGVDDVGKLKRSGFLSANFAADTGRIIDVDHMIGCNMSFRRTALAGMGGFREDCAGTEVGEETDTCLRLKRLGGRIVYNPAAVLDHLGAPQARGRRFDVRYDYYHRRNNLVLRLSNFGLGATTWKFLLLASGRSLLEFVRKSVAAWARLGAAAVGTVVGLWVGVSLLISRGRDPHRHDAIGREIAGTVGSATSARPTGASNDAEDFEEATVANH